MTHFNLYFFLSSLESITISGLGFCRKLKEKEKTVFVIRSHRCYDFYVNVLRFRLSCFCPPLFILRDAFHCFQDLKKRQHLFGVLWFALLFVMRMWRIPIYLACRLTEIYRKRRLRDTTTVVPVSPSINPMRIKQTNAIDPSPYFYLIPPYCHSFIWFVYVFFSSMGKTFDPSFQSST